jgi:hypothetical protein
MDAMSTASEEEATAGRPAEARPYLDTLLRTIQESVGGHWHSAVSISNKNGLSFDYISVSTFPPFDIRVFENVCDDNTCNCQLNTHCLRFLFEYSTDACSLRSSLNSFFERFHKQHDCADCHGEWVDSADTNCGSCQLECAYREWQSEEIVECDVCRKNIFKGKLETFQGHMQTHPNNHVCKRCVDNMSPIKCPMCRATVDCDDDGDD